MHIPIPVCNHNGKTNLNTFQLIQVESKDGMAKSRLFQHLKFAMAKSNV